MSFLRLPAPAAPLPPEVAFLLTEGVDARVLARAADAARAHGTDAASALLNAGLMAEDAYYRALARSLGAPFLDGPIPLSEALRFPGDLAAGLAPLAPGAVAPRVLAPRGRAIAELLAGRDRGAAPAITSPTRLREAVFAAVPERVAAYAAEELRLRAPERATPREPASRWLLFLGLGLVASVCLLAALPPPLRLAVTLAGQALFLAMTLFRVAALAIAPPAVEAPALADADLPVYTVLVALHREARVVGRLVRALAALDYPVLCSNLTHKR